MDGHNVFGPEAQREALRKCQHRGAAIYLTAFIGLMMDAMAIKETSEDGVNALVLLMLTPMNIATEAIWRAMMGDTEWEDAIERLKQALNDISQHPQEF